MPAQTIRSSAAEYFTYIAATGQLSGISGKFKPKRKAARKITKPTLQKH